ncbi:MAG: hypothetical protein IPG60_14465 [Bacteroidetes bacterium]|nr:hypothetical protein [Bacteroidota bacterium]MBK7110174.1 hypothetical protein [Bacteroidota bacterium]MBK8487099.1 hypothetical protein [Bacteroidota bacterium]MBK8680485.1 hypothetical protein [Bacteroidota bacterium]
MRNTVLLFALLVTTIYGCKQDKVAYADYNNEVVNEVKSADSTIRQLFTFKDFEAYPTVMGNYTSAFENINSNLKAIEAPGKDDSLRLAAIDLTTIYEEIAKQDFNTIYQLMHDSIYTPADSIKVDSLSDIMYSKWQIASEKFATIQQDFGAKYKISLE